MIERVVLTPDLKSIVDVSRETIMKLSLFNDMLLEWNQNINLISQKTVSETWIRHIIDSAQLWSLAPVKAKSWLDVGSGGGFPGMVISIIAYEKNPSLQVTLVESNKRKCFFLREVARILRLKINIVSDRIENISTRNFDVVSARAFAKLSSLLYISNFHLRKSGVSLFLKGKNVELELFEAKKFWRFQFNLHKSLSSCEGSVVQIRNDTCEKYE
tara:strand:+ start:192 stop:836 length:645 start_codon:yes stop_codon:yes gene_type:complete